MRKMAAGQFRKHCLSVMERVRVTGEPVLVTKRGAPLVKVVLLASEACHVPSSTN